MHCKALRNYFSKIDSFFCVFFFAKKKRKFSANFDQAFKKISDNFFRAEFENPFKKANPNEDVW